MPAQRVMAWLVGLSMVFALTACQTEKPLPQQRFDLRGKVVVVNKNEGTVTLAHEAIPGYMAAMTMDYPVKPDSELAKLHAGDHIEGTVVVEGAKYYVTDVKVVSKQ